MMKRGVGVVVLVLKLKLFPRVSETRYWACCPGMLKVGRYANVKAK